MLIEKFGYRWNSYYKQNLLVTHLRTDEKMTFLLVVLLNHLNQLDRVQLAEDKALCALEIYQKSVWFENGKKFVAKILRLFVPLTTKCSLMALDNA